MNEPGPFGDDGGLNAAISASTFFTRPVTPMIHALHGKGGPIPAVQRHGTGVFAALAAGA